MTTYRLWPSTNGPATATANGGNFISGTVFFVTGEAWFQGYWWWVCGSGGQNTGATKCALWQLDSGNTPHLVPGSVVTSGTLTAGTWNYIPLTTPLPLSCGGSAGTASPSGGLGGGTYIAAVGVNGPFPDTNNYWGSGQTAPNGITSGPLSAYSGHGGTLPCPYDGGAHNQGVFTTAGTDPSVTCPQGASNTDNFWVDVQVSDYTGAPAGTSLRLWPSLPVQALTANGDNTKAMSGTAFTLSQSCALGKIWMFSPSASTGLPSRCGIWNSTTQALVSGTDSGTSPAWKNSSGASASPGDGWIYVDYSGAGVVLPAGNYITSFYDSAGVRFYYDSANYWFSGTDPKGGGTVGGPRRNGLSWGGGILTAPNVANGPELVYDDSSGTFPGQSAYQPGPSGWVYPGSFEATADWGETRTADVEVTPVSAPSGGPAYTASMASM